MPEFCDTGDLLGSGSITASNSRCTVSSLGMTQVRTANTVTLTIPVSFAPAFHGHKNIYINAFDQTGLLTNWIQTGSWDVPQ
jgi:hypothetical protein